MKNVVLIHGNGGLIKEPYFPHLKDFCTSLGLQVFMPELGGKNDGITYESWKNIFDDEILSYINSETIIVAQSLGTQFAVKYLSEKNLNVGAYISCAAPYDILQLRKTLLDITPSVNTTSKKIKPSKAEFAKFKSFNFPKYSLFSDNDKFFEQSNLERYSNEIGSIPVLTKGKGHYNFSTGITKLDELEDLIAKIAKNVS